LFISRGKKKKEQVEEEDQKQGEKEEAVPIILRVWFDGN
jgi:hypothetical protein